MATKYMLKIRITFVDDAKGNKEVENAKEVIKENFTIVNQSRVYKGRGTSMYSNVYLDVEAK